MTDRVRIRTGERSRTQLQARGSPRIVRSTRSEEETQFLDVFGVFGNLLSDVWPAEL